MSEVNLKLDELFMIHSTCVKIGPLCKTQQFPMDTLSCFSIRIWVLRV